MKKLFILIFIIIIALSLFHLFFITQNKYKNIPIEQKIGQMLIVGLKDLKTIRPYIKKGMIGGVIIFSENITNRSQLFKLIRDIKAIPSPFPIFISIDQEGGLAQRLNKAKGFKNFPSAEKIAELPTDLAYQKYSEMALMLKSYGFNLNFAPVVDLNINPKSPAIGKVHRSYSDDPNTVIKYARSFIRAHNDNKIITCLKHFPGHGSAKGDTHKNLVDISKTWQKIELGPYIKLKKADMTMIGHLFNKNYDNKYPASLSNIWINDILRKRLGYKGLVITDDLQMGAIKKNYKLPETIKLAINAGNNICLFAKFKYKKQDIPVLFQKYVLEYLNTGIISQKDINSSFNKIIKLKKKYELETRTKTK